jgi:hypothetical protein
MKPRLRHRTLFFGLAILASLGLITSGCGGSKSPSVASLGTATSTNANGGVSRGSNSASSGGGNIGMTMEMGRGAVGVKYSACMRSHGQANFPDPNGVGLVTIDSSTGINPNSPVFEKAEADCQKLLPIGQAPTQAQQQQFRRQVLAFAVCMRSHGVPKYPDPTISGVRMTIPNSGIDPNSPIVQAAQKTCQTKAGLVPSSPQGGTASSRANATSGG